MVERARVAVARALALRAGLLVADEPQFHKSMADVGSRLKVPCVSQRWTMTQTKCVEQLLVTRSAIKIRKSATIVLQ